MTFPALSVSLIGFLLDLWGKCGGEELALREIEHGAIRRNFYYWYN
jgi:hypothetical protein